MLTVSCSRLVELDQTICSIIKNPESYQTQTVARLTCIGGKRHILQALHRFMTHLVSTILVLGLCEFKLYLELQTWIYEKIGLNLVNDPNKSWTTRAKNHTNRAKNRTNRANNAATQNVQIFHVFLQFKSWSYVFFLEIQTMLELNNIPITMSENHVWIRSCSLDGNQSDLFSYQLTGLLLCASDIADL